MEARKFCASRPAAKIAWSSSSSEILESSPLVRQLQQERLRELLDKPELLEPLVDDHELVRCARQDAGVDVAPVGAADLRLLRGSGRGVPTRLALHRSPGNQPFVTGGLRRHVGGRVHAHVDVLASTRLIADQQRDQRGHHREVAGRVIALVSPAAHRRQRVVVISAAPHRSASSEQREIRGGLIPARTRAAEGGDGDHDQVLSQRSQLGIVEAQLGQTSRRLALDQEVGAGDQLAKGSARRLALEIEGHAELAGVVVPPVEAALWPRLVVQKRAVAAHRIAARGLDHDDLRAHVGEQLAREGTALARQLDDPQARERGLGMARGSRHMTPSLRSSAISRSLSPRTSPNTRSLCSPRQGAPRRISQSVCER